MAVFIENSDKPKVLFLHGFGSNKKFINNILKVERDFSIVSVDLHYDNEPNSLIKMVNIVKNAIEINNWNNLIVVGASMGGAVATMLSDLKEIKKVVLVSPLNPFFKPIDNLTRILLPKTEDEALKSLAVNVFDNNVWNQVAPINFLVKAFLQYTKKNERNLVNLIKDEIMNFSFLKKNLSPFYSLFSAKIKIINGDYDQIFNIESLEYISKHYKIELLKFKDCGHLPILEKPKEFIEVINRIII